MKKLIINTDGGSRNNPGPAALGYVIKNEDGELLFQEGKFLGVATNNFAEYSAVLEAVKTAKKLQGTDLVLQMDSELIVRQMTGVYKIKEPTLIKLASEIKILLQSFNSYEFKHVRREFNKEADSEVNKALDAELKV